MGKTNYNTGIIANAFTDVAGFKEPKFFWITATAQGGGTFREVTLPSDGNWYIRITLGWDAAGTVYLCFDSDQTATNYYTQRLVADGSSLSCSCNNDNAMMTYSATGRATINIWTTSLTGWNQSAIFECSQLPDDAPASIFHNRGLVVHNSNSQITKIGVRHSSGFSYCGLVAYKMS